MKVIRSPLKLKNFLDLQRKRGARIGFVPTMGYLHEGHLSLVRKAKKENELVVVSIFVNPLQFGPKEDFSRYPRNFARDLGLLKKEKVDVIFKPSAKDLYHDDFQTSIFVTRLSRPLCGRTRPTHFGGVCTVVLKLLNCVMPDVMYLGQKDYQQFRVIQQMVKDLHFPAKVVMAPIIREKDGLAMSSRNVYLSKTERSEAVLLNQALREGKKEVGAGQRNTLKIKSAMRRVLKKASSGRLDYLEIVDADTLQPVVKLTNRSRALMALAVTFGKTRLIDNLIVRIQ